jgi:hypothetical protein
MNTTPTKPRVERASSAFFLIQSILISMMTKAGTSTADIAAKLEVDRSYVIRLASDGVVMAPTNAREQHLFNLATSEEFARKFQNMGLKGLLVGENTLITLAGGERPKLGPLADRRAAKEAKASAQPSLPEPKAEKPAKVARAPKTAKVPEPPPAAVGAKVAKVAKAPKAAKVPDPVPAEAPKAKKKAAEPPKAPKAPKAEKPASKRAKGRVIDEAIRDTATADDIMSA